ncbi:MAG: class I SAM-dependent methyltransferase [Desulfotignum sp.]
MIYDKDNLQMIMIQQLADLDGRAILEVGCGDGRLSVMLARTTRWYIAIDPDKEAIAAARQRTGNVGFHIGYGENLPFADASFDLVIFIFSLHHQNSSQALMETHRVLTPTGRVIILEPDANGEFQQFFHLFDDETDDLTSAINAIRHSQFDLIHHDIFEVPADFDNLADLFQYQFDKSPADETSRSNILAKLLQFRGGNTESQPIQLLDRIHIFSLKKHNDTARKDRAGAD